MCVVVVLGGACIAAARCSVLRWRVQPGDAGCYTDDLECCSVQSVYIYILSECKMGDAVCCADDLECCSVQSVYIIGV